MDITEKACQQLKKIFHQYPDKKALRVYIQGGGCSGFEYNFELVDSWQDDDFIYEKSFQGTPLILCVDELSSGLLQGAFLDYKVSLSGSRFVIDNPNVSGQCSCGSSFSL